MWGCTIGSISVGHRWFACDKLNVNIKHISTYDQYMYSWIQTLNFFFLSFNSTYGLIWLYHNVEHLFTYLVVFYFLLRTFIWSINFYLSILHLFIGRTHVRYLVDWYKRNISTIKFKKSTWLRRRAVRPSVRLMNRWFFSNFFYSYFSSYGEFGEFSLRFTAAVSAVAVFTKKAAHYIILK